jgi:hypothetical protein
MRPQPCVQNRKHASKSPRSHRKTPGIPRAMVLTVSFVLSPVTGLFVTVAPKKPASHGLDASAGASGPHDFAVRLTRCSSIAHRRPPHPAAHVRDDRETPLVWDGIARDKEVIWVGWEQEYF